MFKFSSDSLCGISVFNAGIVGTEETGAKLLRGGRSLYGKSKGFVLNILLLKTKQGLVSGELVS